MVKPQFQKQVAAMPWRIKDGAVEILLVTTRETQRWVIPKGWPMVGRSDDQAAQLEAYEEAGVHGHIAPTPAGQYDYMKRRAKSEDVAVRVDVYAMQVSRELAGWPESKERARAWYTAETAASMVLEEDLGALITKFAAHAARALPTAERPAHRSLWTRLKSACAKSIRI